MTARRWIVSGCLLAALTVLVAAFAALHTKRLDNPPVPILSRIPSIPGPQGHLLPSNPAVTDRLMMLVTPPLIIQEEEEAKLLGQAP